MSNINMNIFITIFIFITILLLYLHFMNEFKYVKQLSIYDVEYTTRNQLQKICELKQPFVSSFALQSNEKINKEHNMCIFDKNDNEFVNITYRALEELLEKNKEGVYYSMKNYDFANDELNQEFTELNKYINPYFSYNTIYDVLMGSNNVNTPLLYLRESGLFLFLKKGKVNIKLSTYDKDIENSTICLWDDSKNYNISDISLLENQILFIPSWCFYTLQFEENSIIYSVCHQTPTNLIINTQYYILEFLQSQNVEEKVLKTIEMPEDIKEEEPDKEPDNIENIDQ